MRGVTALPKRKRLNHRGPLSVAVAGAWYFVTICAEGHRPWVMTKDPDAPMRFKDIAETILREARENHIRGVWRLSLLLIMPDHMHFIVNIPKYCGGHGVTALPDDGQAVGSAPRADRMPTLPSVVANFKHLLANRYGIRFQRDFWDTRLRDNAQYAEKFHYVCNNPVRKGLCRVARDWPFVIAFDKCTGEERSHR